MTRSVCEGKGSRDEMVERETVSLTPGRPFLRDPWRLFYTSSSPHFDPLMDVSLCVAEVVPIHVPGPAVWLTIGGRLTITFLLLSVLVMWETSFRKRLEGSP